ncbi:MAG: hypothetical protein GX610_20845 [Rhodococcus sp.]|nr:hypothetical protein [Rhodococcus sp. (in: high G+C Gram-positive bacteria)]
MNSQVPGYIVCAVGGALAGIGLIWGVVVGFYPSDRPMVIGLMLVGAALLWGGQRMFQSAKRSQIEQAIADRAKQGEY